VSLRDNPLGELKVPLTWFGAVSLVVAIVAAAAFFLSDRRETFKAEAYGATRKASDTVLTPVGDALATPGRWIGQGADTVRDYFFAASENQELKAQLKEMRQWRDVAIALRSENARYRTLLGLKTDPPIPMVAARIVTDSHGPFADTRLANAGADKGVKPGNPVMSENGLVGRVIGVTEGASRVLLLTDIASRTPVMIDRTNARAILTGDGGPNPRLDYLRGRDPIREGDRVLSSGDGGVVPRGLPVGTAVKGLDGRWRVVLASDRAPIDFVRILLFQDFTELVNQKELAKLPPPPPTPGDPTATPLAPLAPPPAAKTAANAAPDATGRTAGEAKSPAAAAKAPADGKTPAKAGEKAKETTAAKAAAGAAKPVDKTKPGAAADASKKTAGKSLAASSPGEKSAATKTAATADKPKPPAAKPKPKPVADEAPQ
jgi:rod shape-determining protein MreC